MSPSDSWNRLGVPNMESFDSFIPELFVSQAEDFNHAPTLIAMINKVLAILLWTQDILLAFGLLEVESLALLPWMRYLEETFCLGEDRIENIERMDHILELGGFCQLNGLWNLRQVDWSEADHHT